MISSRHFMINLILMRLMINLSIKWFLIHRVNLFSYLKTLYRSELAFLLILIIISIYFFSFMTGHQSQSIVLLFPLKSNWFIWKIFRSIINLLFIYNISLLINYLITCYQILREAYRLTFLFNIQLNNKRCILTKIYYL